METLYQKIGGKPSVDKMIASFYRHVFADPLLSPFFTDTSIERLTKMQSAFFAIALGGGEPKDMPSLFAVHQGRGIKSQHLTRFVETLALTLREHGVAEADTQKVYERIATYSNDILGDASVDG